MWSILTKVGQQESNSLPSPWWGGGGCTELQPDTIHLTVAVMLRPISMVLNRQPQAGFEASALIVSQNGRELRVSALEQQVQPEQTSNG